MGTVLQFIISIAILIFIHELGHYIGAMIAGIEIEEFGIGFPPKITKLFTFRGTEFTLNWLPLGGFVRPKGEEGLTETGDEFMNAPPINRLVFLFAGPIFNLLTAVVLFSFIFSTIGLDINKISITDIAPNSPAEIVGLQIGDVINQMDGIKIKSFGNIFEISQANLDKNIEIVITRNKQDLLFILSPRANPPEGEGAMGIAMANPIGVDISILQAVKSGFVATGDGIKSMFNMVKMLITKNAPEDARLVGYKGMFEIYNANKEADESMPEFGNVNTLSFFATISISLGIMNLLPIPALDGGRILFTLPELFFKKKIPLKIQNILNAIFFLLLILAMFYVNIQDFLNPISFQ